MRLPCPRELSGPLPSLRPFRASPPPPFSRHPVSRRLFSVQASALPPKRPRQAFATRTPSRSLQTCATLGLNSTVEGARGRCRCAREERWGGCGRRALVGAMRCLRVPRARNRRLCVIDGFAFLSLVLPPQKLEGRFDEVAKDGAASEPRPALAPLENLPRASPVGKPCGTSSADRRETLLASEVSTPVTQPNAILEADGEEDVGDGENAGEDGEGGSIASDEEEADAHASEASPRAVVASEDDAEFEDAPEEATLLDVTPQKDAAIEADREQTHADRAASRLEGRSPDSAARADASPFGGVGVRTRASLSARAGVRTGASLSAAADEGGEGAEGDGEADENAAPEPVATAAKKPRASRTSPVVSSKATRTPRRAASPSKSTSPTRSPAGEAKPSPKAPGRSPRKTPRSSAATDAKRRLAPAPAITKRSLSGAGKAKRVPVPATKAARLAASGGKTTSGVAAPRGRPLTRQGTRAPAVEAASKRSRSRSSGSATASASAIARSRSRSVASATASASATARSRPRSAASADASARLGPRAASGSTASAPAQSRPSSVAGESAADSSGSGAAARARGRPPRERAEAAEGASVPSRGRATSSSSRTGSDRSSSRPRVHSMRTRSLSTTREPPASPWRSMAEKVAEFEGRDVWAAAHAERRRVAEERARAAAGASSSHGLHLTQPKVRRRSHLAQLWSEFARPPPRCKRSRTHGDGRFATLHETGAPRSLSQISAPQCEVPPAGLTSPPLASSFLPRSQSPALVTKSRARPSRFKPTEEVEVEEIAALPRFRARPFDRHLFEGGAKGLHAPAPKPVTEPQPFELRTDKRAARAAAAATASELQERPWYAGTWYKVG